MILRFRIAIVDQKRFQDSRFEVKLAVGRCGRCPSRAKGLTRLSELGVRSVARRWCRFAAWVRPRCEAGRPL